MKLGRLVFVRHGESVWNVTDKLNNRVTRFTGWADIPLSNVGVLQAEASGRCLKNLQIKFDAVFTSLLKRSRLTYSSLAKELGCEAIPVVSSWRLNERHYGALVGLSKDEAELELGRERVMGWRKSWDLRPPPMKELYFFDSSDGCDQDWQREIWTKAMTIKTHDSGNEDLSVDTQAIIPKSESLQDTAERVFPLWRDDILPRIIRGENVLVVGHSNTIRSMVKHLDGLWQDAVRHVTIPSAIPLLYSFEIATSGQLRTIGKPSPLGMRGRFIVTKELLELSLLASQHLEMSENLDENDEFKNLIRASLEDVSRGGGIGRGASDSFCEPEFLAPLSETESEDRWSELRKARSPGYDTSRGRIMNRGWMNI